MKTKFIYLLLFGLLYSSVSFAQLHPNTPLNGETDIIAGDKSANPIVVYNILIKNAPVIPDYAKSLPRFSIVGKDSKFYINIGATVKATASFDWGNPLNMPSYFMPSYITPVEPGNGGKVQMTAQQSQLYFNFVGLPGTDNQLGAYVSIYFAGNNNNYGVIVNNAYIKYRGITAGYKFTMFCDMSSLPYTIDTEGPNPSPAVRNTVLDYENNLSDKWKMGVGLEVPLNSYTTYGEASSVNQRVPDIPLYIQYSWKPEGNGHIRLSGIFRNLIYRNDIKDKNKDVFGWGVKLSGLAQMGNFTAYYMGIYGQGIANYLQDNNGLGLDLVPSNKENGTLQRTKTWGAYGGLQYNFNKNLFSTIVYSQLRNYMDPYTNGTLSYGDQYKWGQYIGGNLIWNVNSFVQTGVEYLYGRRMNFDGTQAHDNRINALLQVSF